MTAEANGHAAPDTAAAYSGKPTEKPTDKPAEKPAEKAATTRDAASPEALAKVAEVRARLLTAVGQVTLALSGLPRYRHQSLADLQHLVLEPLVRDRIAIATPRGGGEGEGEAERNAADFGQLAGIAFWASVSPEVDVKIREQIKAGVFPVRLKPEEWTSGDLVWLLDVIAPNQRLATAVLTSFGRVAQGRQVVIHPVVTRQVDRAVLEKLGARRADGGEAGGGEAGGDAG